jgi:hypothetical protein
MAKVIVGIELLPEQNIPDGEAGMSPEQIVDALTQIDPDDLDDVMGQLREYYDKQIENEMTNGLTP